MKLGRIPFLALAIATAHCTSPTDLETRPTPTSSTNTAPTVPRRDDETSTPPQDVGLPEGFGLVATGVAGRAAPAGATPVRTVAVVGASREDPRFLEYTFFETGDAAATETTVDLTGLIGDSEVVDLANGRFAFLTDESTPIPDRSEAALLTHGPSINAVFRSVVDEDLIVVGGSGGLQPTDIDVVLSELSVDDVPLSSDLPSRMTVLVDGVLPKGRFVELSSVHGTIAVVVYDDIGREWFDYFTWGDPSVPLPADVATLASDVSMQPNSNFGIGGSAVDPVRLSFWSDDRLAILEYPDSSGTDDVTALATLFLNESSFDRLVAATPELESIDEPPTTIDEPDGSTSEPPSGQDMAAFQRFVETSLEVEHVRQISFNYVPDFPTDGISFDFISSDLWLVAVALGLTENGQTLDGANQSRLDAVRGTPGTIELQPTQTETDVVTVHEMVHVIDLDTIEVASAEPFSMSQVVSEGNAHRIAYDYLQTLDPDERAIMEPFPHIFPAGGDPRISRAVQDLLEFPYDEGRLFMAAAAEHGGQSTVREIFGRPPVSTEQVLFFDAWLRNDEPMDVPAPSPPRGASEVGQGSLGAYLLLLVATDLDGGDEALGALEEWAGDGYVLYETKAQICLAAEVVFDSASAATALGLILEELADTAEVQAETLRATFCT